MTKEINNIKFGISKKKDGQMILREDGEGLKNRIKYFSNLGINIESIVSTGLIHGNNVSIVSIKDKGKKIEGTDGLITNEKNLCLTITVSDCLPVFIYNEKEKVIGIAHMGWKSIIKNISNSIVEKFKNNYNSDLNNLKVFIGPHIKECHFEIKEDSLDKFSEYSEFIKKKDSKLFVNLGGIVKKQFLTLGLKNENIEISPECTYCNEEYLSFRRDRPEKVTSQVAYVYIKKDC